MNRRSTFLGNKHSLDINVFGRKVHEIDKDKAALVHMNDAGLLTRLYRSLTFVYVSVIKYTVKIT